MKLAGRFSAVQLGTTGMSLSLTAKGIRGLKFDEPIPLEVEGALNKSPTSAIN